MRTNFRGSEGDGFAILNHEATKVLDAKEERELLGSLGELRGKLTNALEAVKSAAVPEGGDDPQSLSSYIARYNAGHGSTEASLGVVFRRYAELRGKLALANMRLVAHVAKRFRDRGVSYSDLLQEGFCGLLEAIDRFDLTRETKLATYATWWIRQSMQKAVAGGAYPVRLSPRHLRQLAQNQDEVDRTTAAEAAGLGLAEGAGSTELIHRIHSATRPTVSLDASFDADSNFSLLQTMCDPEGDRTVDIDTDETIQKLMEALRPREREVLALRFGLGDQSKHSLSQVGKVLHVSKERARQIQDRALEKLRACVEESNIGDLLVNGA